MILTLQVHRGPNIETSMRKIFIAPSECPSRRQADDKTACPLHFLPPTISGSGYRFSPCQLPLVFFNVRPLHHAIMYGSREASQMLYIPSRISSSHAHEICLTYLFCVHRFQHHQSPWLAVQVLLDFRRCGTVHLWPCLIRG